ncbi:winged helix-turn-helix transcriptional regulator [Nakamurella flavida]|uniref:Winged helix-turn-helix transcriptional regulator n=1 Tax=Nakamurella flavida TaxID=363630 RepID=A0A939BZ05_9ACTN|nr:winged helix-turn-helix transcriptional regulator [Nakamurella flavida]
MPDAFWSVARRLRETFRETTAPWEITPAQARALVVLLRRGSIRLSDLSADLRIAPRSATEVVDALADRGLVARGPDPTDRRAVLVTVTPAGHAAGAAIGEARAAEADRFFAALPEADRLELHRLLRALLP